MRTTWWMTTLVLVVSALAACSSSPTSASSTPPVGGVNVPTQSASASATPTSTPSAQLISDPCQVLPQSEASTLSGVSMPAGVSQPWGTGGAVKCGYTSGSVEAFLILQKASSSAQAQAAWDDEKATLQQEAQPTGITITANAVTGLGDEAEVFVGKATIGGVNNTIMAIFVLKGATFMDLGDYALRNATPPTTAALEAQATTSASRV